MKRPSRLDALGATLARAVGGRLLAATVADDGAMALRFESGSVVVLAAIAVTPTGSAPRLDVAWYEPEEAPV